MDAEADSTSKSSGQQRNRSDLVSRSDCLIIFVNPALLTIIACVY